MIPIESAGEPLLRVFPGSPEISRLTSVLCCAGKPFVLFNKAFPLCPPNVCKSCKMMLLGPHHTLKQYFIFPMLNFSSQQVPQRPQRGQMKNEVDMLQRTEAPCPFIAVG
ncbi:hypothetical protein XENOCAPTIV_011683 [Xenoophorus captivus]|uniref:Uncharacterized protein n=1 Tax=Xenoophorus captivus TaxID=1517983 RepID=A0ABV0SEP6_9TELE